MSAPAGILLLITLWASMQEGLGHPVVQHQEAETSDLVPTHGARNKRCACNNQLDSECHYFCHLDIIWVNTASKTTVYGLGSAFARRRRAVGRCTCASLDDHACANFCSRSTDIKSPKTAMKRLHIGLLGILRAAASSSRRARDAASSDGDEAR